jgi:hypothetical protein
LRAAHRHPALGRLSCREPWPARNRSTLGTSASTARPKRHVVVVLTAPVINKELAAQYDDAFPAVILWDTQYFADWLYGATLGMRERHLIAFDRQLDAQHTLDQHVAVLRRASEIDRWDCPDFS